MPNSARMRDRGGDRGDLPSNERQFLESSTALPTQALRLYLFRLAIVFT
jgi:hypothetical protein